MHHHLGLVFAILGIFLGAIGYASFIPTQDQTIHVLVVQTIKASQLRSAAVPMTVASVRPARANPISSHGNIRLRDIALTFDDGPNPAYTPQILSILEHFHIHATFFNIGRLVQKYPQITREIYADGNIVGNHTWNHPNLTKLSASQIDQQLDATNLIIQQTVGTRPVFMRPPYGAINAYVRAQIVRDGLVPVLWNIDTKDWTRPGAAYIENVVIHQAKNGDIVLMHDGGGDRSQTVAALPVIIQKLQRSGFQFITMKRLPVHYHIVTGQTTRRNALK